MTSNRTWLSFLLLRTRNSISTGSWKMAKRRRTEWKTFDWSKFIFCIEKIEFYFTIKKPKLLSCQPNISLWRVFVPRIVQNAIIHRDLGIQWIRKYLNDVTITQNKRNENYFIRKVTIYQVLTTKCVNLNKLSQCARLPRRDNTVKCHQNNPSTEQNETTLCWVPSRALNTYDWPQFFPILVNLQNKVFQMGRNSGKIQSTQTRKRWIKKIILQAKNNNNRNKCLKGGSTSSTFWCKDI